MKAKAVLYINGKKVGESDSEPLVRELFNDILSKKEPVKNETPYTIEISDVGPRKIAAIKAVRNITGIGLKEAKDLVESYDRTITVKGFENYANACRLLRNAGCLVLA
jgi:ribosomal protein L7/L12